MSDIGRNIEQELTSGDPVKILAALVTLTLENQDIDPSLVIDLLGHDNDEIKLAAMQALSMYEGRQNGRIIGELKKYRDNLHMQAMLLAALSNQPNEEAISYLISLLSDEDNLQNELAVELLVNYGKICIIPLIYRIEQAEEQELGLIKLIFNRIGKVHAVGILKGLPDLLRSEKMGNVFSQNELEELRREL